VGCYRGVKDRAVPNYDTRASERVARVKESTTNVSNVAVLYKRESRRTVIARCCPRAIPVALAVPGASVKVYSESLLVGDDKGAVVNYAKYCIDNWITVQIIPLAVIPPKRAAVRVRAIYVQDAGRRCPYVYPAAVLKFNPGQPG